MERIIVLDIETLPDLVAGRALLGDAGLGMDDATLRAALGARVAREGQDPSQVFLKPVLHRMCVLGILRAERDTPDAPWRVPLVKARSIEEMPEAELLTRLDRMLGGRPQPVLVGFNTTGFDVPVLRYRALALGVPMPHLLSADGRNYTHRYSAGHVDLCDRLSGFRATAPPSLSEACSLLGIPAKGGMNGQDVEPAMAAGRAAEVAAYCETDVAATWMLWLAWMRAMGAMPVDLVAESFALFAETLEADAAPHLADHAAAARRLAGL